MIENKLAEHAKSQIDKGLSYLEGFSKGYHQAKSEWVGLTRSEVLDIVDSTSHPLEFYRSIEAKLKERNT